jgi:hypothetical protein
MSDENIWNNTEKLQPYYDFISKIKQMWDGDWPNLEPIGPLNATGFRTSKGVYLEMDGYLLGRLWTPFGQVKFHNAVITGYPTGYNKFLLQTNKVLEKLPEICEMKELKSRPFGVWNTGDCYYKQYSLPVHNKIYHLHFKDNDSSNLLFTYVRTGMSEEQEKEIFSIVSKGTNKF